MIDTLPFGHKDLALYDTTEDALNLMFEYFTCSFINNIFEENFLNDTDDEEEKDNFMSYIPYSKQKYNNKIKTELIKKGILRVKSKYYLQIKPIYI